MTDGQVHNLLNEYINEPGSESKQPSISHGGDTLYFSSNRPGGEGGSDIWMSLKGRLETESWTPAINLGSAINTPENEISPYFSSPFGCLLFASNGHVGYGGYDLFAAKGESFFEPKIYNLGSPFNSTHDDTYFNISDSIGFISSNRVTGNVLDIYRFDVNNEALFLSLLISGEKLIDSQIASRFRDVGSMDLTAFRVEDYQGFDLYDPEKRVKPQPAILGGPSGSEYSPVASGNYEYQVPFENIYFDFGWERLRPQSVAALDDLVNQISAIPDFRISILAYTDPIGSDSSNAVLSRARGEAVKSYLLSKGVNEDQVAVFARGELNLESGNDHWFKRVLRRRVEIVVETNSPVNLNTATPVILRKEGSIQEIAARLSCDYEQLIDLNGEHSGNLMAGHVIRFDQASAQLDINYFLDQESVESLFK